MIETLTNLESHRDTAVNITQEIFSTMLGIEAWPAEQAPGGDRSHTVVGPFTSPDPGKGSCSSSVSRSKPALLPPN